MSRERQERKMRGPLLLTLLAVCPYEVAHLRKELLIAARHILATKLKKQFVPFMEKFLDSWSQCHLKSKLWPLSWIRW